MDFITMITNTVLTEDKENFHDDIKVNWAFDGIDWPDIRKVVMGNIIKLIQIRVDF